MNHPAEILAVRPIDPAMVPKIHAVAINATEMAEANAEIKVFITAKLASIQAEKDGITEAYMAAEQNGWKTDALATTEKRLIKDLEYYGKLLLALEAGYTVVPNMPCDQFAIRVARRGATSFSSYKQDANHTPRNWQMDRIPDQKEQILPAGDGRYESPTPTTDDSSSSHQGADGKLAHTRFIQVTGFDAIEFPFAAAVPVVMSATQAAMALKLFDRIGIVPQEVKRNMDPIILGQIVRRENGRDRVASFLIAWHLDMRTL
jgi:hypothetical protein